LSYPYRPQVLEELERFGVRPTASTRPELVHDFLNDLYRCELRRLRNRLVQGEIRKPDYHGYVVDLRKKYLLLSVPLRLWTE